MGPAGTLKRMPLVIAAIRTGHDPVGKLPDAAFHTTLDRQLVCPKCSATYNLVVDYAASVGRFFEQESHRLILMLQKAIQLGHANGHRVSHFETAGVVVTTHVPEHLPAADSGKEAPSPAGIGADSYRAGRRPDPVR